MSFGNRRLAIRADADSTTGTGHVMRTLSVAMTWNLCCWSVDFYCARIPDALSRRLADLGFHVHRLESESIEVFIAELGQNVPDWVVLDGYHFSSEHQKRLKEAGYLTLVFDDYGHGTPYSADLVVNPNLGADPALYAQCDPSVRLLLGADYVQLRPEFLQHSRYRKEIVPVARRLLITMGGSDPANATALALRALALLPETDWHATAVVGPACGHLDSLREIAARDPARIEIFSNVPDLSDLYMQADLAIAAGGTTTWERAYFGLPSLIVSIAENQVAVAAACDREGIAVDLGRIESLSVESLVRQIHDLMFDAERRRAMADRGRETIDGHGTRRLLAAMRGVPELLLRNATEGDTKLILDWANDPVTRGASFQSDPIPWERHVEWMAKQLAAKDVVFLIVELQGVVGQPGIPVGQVRFVIESQKATISISIAPEARGRGIASRAIREASEYLFRRRNVQQIEALIRTDNVASRRAFEKAGYEFGRPLEVNGIPSVSNVLNR
jgi:UDP-2,4-diacetamido-2,4,6-trideoxy-beta-L-altropyranose hydrolase